MLTFHLPSTSCTVFGVIVTVPAASAARAKHTIETTAASDAAAKRRTRVVMPAKLPGIARDPHADLARLESRVRERRSSGGGDRTRRGHGCTGRAAERRCGTGAERRDEVAAAVGELRLDRANAQPPRPRRHPGERLARNRRRRVDRE